MEVVPMTLNDTADVAQLEMLCFSDPWSENSFKGEMENPLAVYFVAKDNERCIGYCGYWSIVGEGHITNVAVSPEYRRKGVGGMLIKKMIESAVSEKLSLLTLEVRQSNVAAQRLYTKFGFEKLGERVDYYQNPRENAWIMTKNFNI